MPTSSVGPTLILYCIPAGIYLWPH